MKDHSHKKLNKYLGQFLVLLIKNKGHLICSYDDLIKFLSIGKGSWKMWDRTKFDKMILFIIKTQLKEINYDLSIKRNENNDYIFVLKIPKIIIKEVFKPLTEKEKEGLHNKAKQNYQNSKIKRYILSCLIKKHWKNKQTEKWKEKEKELKQFDKENFYNPKR